MNLLKRSVAPALFVCLLAAHAASSPEQPPPEKVTVRVASYAELGKVVRALTGKVVVVDFWSTTCPPCMAKFPHLVAMHRAHAGKGLAAISVSLDPPANAKKQKRVQEFLTQQKATFTNLVLDAPPEEYTKKLRFDGPPCIYLFDRSNRIAGKWPTSSDEGVDYEAIEKKALDLLKQ